MENKIVSALLAIIFIIGLFFFNVWCLSVVYNYGVWPILANLQIYPPAIGFSTFIMIYIVWCFIYNPSKTEKYDINSSKFWEKIESVIFNKLLCVFFVWLCNVIFF